MASGHLCIHVSCCFNHIVQFLGPLYMLQNPCVLTDDTSSIGYEPSYPVLSDCQQPVGGWRSSEITIDLQVVEIRLSGGNGHLKGGLCNIRT